MTHHQDTDLVKPSPCLYRTEALDLLRQLSADAVPDHVRAVLDANDVSTGAVAAVFAVLLELGGWKPGGWCGYFRRLEGRHRSYRTVRRAMRALRAVGVVEGAPESAAQDEDGRWTRPAGRYAIRLPRWCRARHWRTSRVSAGPPSGHYGTDTRFVTESLGGHPILDAQKPDPRARAPVDNGPGDPPSADYLAARARLKVTR